MGWANTLIFASRSWRLLLDHRHTDCARLEESEIDMSCKFDLFDVLDADLSGELEFEDWVTADSLTQQLPKQTSKSMLAFGNDCSVMPTPYCFASFAWGWPNYS